MTPNAPNLQWPQQRIILNVIPKPSNGARSVLVLDAPGTVILEGEAQLVSYDCGNCGSPLMVNVRGDQVRNVVMKCNNCGAYNEKV